MRTNWLLSFPFFEKLVSISISVEGNRFNCRSVVFLLQSLLNDTFYYFCTNLHL